MKSSLFKSYVYGIAVFTSGVSWIFNSIYYYGGEHLFFSLIMLIHSGVKVEGEPPLGFI